jgi:hypothetical protein
MAERDSGDTSRLKAPPFSLLSLTFSTKGQSRGNTGVRRGKEKAQAATGLGCMGGDGGESKTMACVRQVS